MVQTLLPRVALQFTIMTTCIVTNDMKVGILTTFGLHWSNGIAPFIIMVLTTKPDLYSS